MHTEHADLGDNMSRVQGAVVVRRPELTRNSSMPAAANKLDFTKTLQSYFPFFRNSLLPR